MIFIGVLFTLDNFLYAQSPDWLWARSAGHASGYSVALDVSENAYVAGYYNNFTIIGSDTLTCAGWSDILLVKYNASGNVLWTRYAGGTEVDIASSVKVDPSGNVYVTGYFSSETITFDTINLNNASSLETTSDIFVCKYDSSGNLIWARCAGGLKNDLAQDISVDASGNIYISGYFRSSTIIFGTDTLINKGNSDVFLVKYDNNGNIIWVRGAGGTDEDVANSVSLDSSGNLLVAGGFDSPTVIFGTDTLTNAGSTDIYLVKYDSYGNIIWAKRAGGTSTDYAKSVATDSLGNIFMTGSFESQKIIFGLDTLTHAGSGDVYLVKYDDSGSVIWARSSEGTGDDRVNSVFSDASGNVFITGGNWGSSVTFGSFTLVYYGNWDIFLVKYDNSGNVLWAKSAGGATGENSFSVAVNADGNIYLTGTFSGTTLILGPDTLTFSGSSPSMFLAKLGSTIVSSGTISYSSSILPYPNPAAEKITVEVPAGIPCISVEITSINGQTLMQQDLNGPTATIGIGNLPAGIYIVKVIGGRASKVGKFVKY